MTVVQEPPDRRLVAPARRFRPDPVVHLHIGAMKTGTTFLQGLLSQHRDQLAEAGLLYPGAGWRDQVRAVQDVMGSTHGDPTIEAQARGAWRRVTREMLAHSGGASLLSMEFLSHADVDQAHRVISSLGSAEVHVVITVRDATATIPAQWQTAVRNGSTLRWEDFRRGARRAGGRRARPGRWSDPAATKFRNAQDVARMLDVWRRFVPADRIHVVTVPRHASDPLVLWRRFSAAFGIDLEVDLDETSVRGNRSLGYASTEVLRRVNDVLTAGADSPALSDYNALVRDELAGRVLAGRDTREARPALDHRTADFALAWNARTADALRTTGVDLIGELGDLPVRAGRRRVSGDPRQPPPTAVELVEVAEEALPAFRRTVVRRAARARRRGIDVPSLPRAVTSGRQGKAYDDALGAAVQEIADLCRHGIALRRALRAR